jgi:hypothetical protein
MEWIVGITTGLISGFLSAAVVSLVFYRLAGRDLAREADDLRQLNMLLMNALEEVGIAEVNRDANGKPIGLRYRRHVDERVTVSETVKAVVVPHHPERLAE